MAMPLPKPTESNFENPPAGTHMAICYRIIDLGTQETTYKGTPKKQHKILVSWELPDEKMTDGRSFTISNRYTWSMSEKAALRKDLESWRGKPFQDADFGEGGFDVAKIIGVACLLTIVHTENGDKKYANVRGISSLMKGMVAPALTNEKVFIGLTDENWNAEAFHKLSDNLQNTIKSSPEYRAMVDGYTTTEGPIHDARDYPDMEDKIPF